jgi:hypothetical protein
MAKDLQYDKTDLELGFEENGFDAYMHAGTIEHILHRIAQIEIFCLLPRAMRRACEKHSRVHVCNAAGRKQETTKSWFDLKIWLLLEATPHIGVRNNQSTNPRTNSKMMLTWFFLKKFPPWTLFFHFSCCFRAVSMNCSCPARFGIFFFLSVVCIAHSLSSVNYCEMFWERSHPHA